MSHAGFESTVPRRKASTPAPDHDANDVHVGSNYLWNFVHYAKGDPALSAWECAFVESMQRKAPFGRITEKQWTVCEAIYCKLRDHSVFSDDSGEDIGEPTDPEIESQPDPNTTVAAYFGPDD